jgi:hypothetical protein
MEKLRISERNTVRNDIKQLESIIKRNKETIDRLRNQEKSDFNTKQIEKSKTALIENEDKLKELEVRLDNISSGKLDNELSEKINITNSAIKNKEQLNTDKNKIKRETKKKEEKSNLDTEYRNRRREGISDYGIQKETDRFIRDCETIPDYILQNLEEMPNNKGYIWKGIMCYGKKPSDSDTITMFEKNRGGVLKIHETTRDLYMVYEKIGKTQKNILIKENRIPKLNNQQLQSLKYL